MLCSIFTPGFKGVRRKYKYSTKTDTWGLKMNLAQALNQVITWGSEADLEGVKFCISKVNDEEIRILKE